MSHVAHALFLIVAVACGSAAPPAPTSPASVPSEVTPAADDHAMQATPTCHDQAPEPGMPRPLWTTRLDSTETLPCDADATTGVHGFLKDGRGTPVSCATAIVTSLQGVELGRAVTDAHGCYVVGGLPPGRADVSIVFGSARGSLVVNIPATGLARFDGTLEQ